MAWSKNQKNTFVMACKSAGLDEEHRRLILRQSPRSTHEGRVTSTSPRLNQSDFEHCMATVESSSAGRCRLLGAGGRVIKQYPYHYWRDTLENGPKKRLRYKVQQLDAELQRVNPDWQPNGVGLKGWIKNRVMGGQETELDDLPMTRLEVLINQLSTYLKTFEHAGDGAHAEAV